MNKQEVYRCTHCDSDKVYADAWIGLNDDNILGPFDQYYCTDCEGECSIYKDEDK